MRIGPAWVAIVTLPGTMIGSVSVAWSGTVWPLCPTMMMRVPRDGEAADDLQRAGDGAEAAARRGDAPDDAAARRGRVVAVHRIDVVGVAAAGRAAGAAVVHAAVDRPEARAVGVDAAVAGRAAGRCSRSRRCWRRRGRSRCRRRSRTARSAAGRRRVADGRRAVGRVGLALRVGRARTAVFAFCAPQMSAGGRAGAVAAGAVAVADAGRSPGSRCGRRRRRGRPRTAASVEQPPQVLGGRDAAELTGRAVRARAVAVAGDAAARDADRGRRRTTDRRCRRRRCRRRGRCASAASQISAAGAVGRHAALTGDAHVADAEVLRAVRGDAGGVGRCTRTHESVAVLQIWPPPQSEVDRHMPDTQPPFMQRWLVP